LKEIHDHTVVRLVVVVGNRVENIVGVERDVEVADVGHILGIWPAYSLCAFLVVEWKVGIVCLDVVRDVVRAGDLLLKGVGVERVLDDSSRGLSGYDESGV
jgi:hypothetical protein